MAKLDVKALGLTLGIVWGVALLIMGMVAMFFNYGGGFVRALGSIYYGYEATTLGSLIGGFWGFIDAGICGIIIAWLYNKFAK
ncbi:MAG: bacteriophage holin [Candidatus Omnitrophica bacterium]|nr:bacteriophage holin [Candidatus Omnitrophota bacterium]